MIAYIKGVLADKEESRVIVETGGIGYGIFVPQSDMERLPKTGNMVELYTYFHVKEDEMKLFGFLSKEEKELFKLIIGVSGIGPKGGLSILSALSPNALRMAVVSGDAKAIAKSPGIGKKTAEKLILELKDKLNLEQMLEQTSEGAANIENTGVQGEVIEALTELGYGQTEAWRAVRNSGLEEGDTAESLLKRALKNIMF
ncbi:Holliday junction branch migration protein RuvA [Clostridiaceae bacterium 68-1-5]|uniref:Holliday junction branch migration complex subunit RuvA n=1 Tax=Suipraeoptans intestinalis TaxID=2606628 RepID=A0A6N7UQW8_9FIRM|nr:Holliday junction branch migration protein RuvA [Suipraeoptans intestinalis]MDY3122250.1 Holliday junction branch migration protein RuvA [Suipraeoptans intestinalis]MSR93011.1 Holliday junction branch migration protein RuvA [Suipraeoptans intestinalis]